MELRRSARNTEQEDYLPEPGLALPTPLRCAVNNHSSTERADYARAEDGPLIGSSAAFRRLREAADALAPMPVDLMLLGETGSGKDMLAKYIHERSGRSGAFVAINCAGIPETLFESEMFGCEAGAYTGATKPRSGKLENAHQGTLFLDEIESMPLAFQAKLLRVLQDHRIERLGGAKSIACDFRVITATKTDLVMMANNGSFRLDLYYRLNVVELAVPALRERKDDILELFRYFFKQAAKSYSDQEAEPLTPSLASQLLAYDWPGNVRELKAAAVRAVLGWPALPATTTYRPVSNGSTSNSSLRDALKNFEMSMISSVIARCGGCVQKAAEELDLPLQTLYYRMKKLGLDSNHGRKKRS